MPKEVRQITFNGAEIANAITDYHRRRNLPMPSGNIVRVRVTADPEISATLRIQDDANRMNTVEVSAATLAAALILFCINRGIPLPAEAEKRLQRIGDEDIALLVIRRYRRLDESE
jgi:hypothetical protein